VRLHLKMAFSLLTSLLAQKSTVRYPTVGGGAQFYYDAQVLLPWIVGPLV
jgi:hypothetical protein